MNPLFADKCNQGIEIQNLSSITIKMPEPRCTGTKAKEMKAKWAKESGHV